MIFNNRIDVDEYEIRRRSRPEKNCLQNRVMYWYQNLYLNYPNICITVAHVDADPFKERLHSTPATAMGLQLGVHYSLNKRNRWLLNDPCRALAEVNTPGSVFYEFRKFFAEHRFFNRTQSSNAGIVALHAMDAFAEPSEICSKYSPRRGQPWSHFAAENRQPTKKLQEIAAVGKKSEPTLIINVSRCHANIFVFSQRSFASLNLDKGGYKKENLRYWENKRIKLEIRQSLISHYEDGVDERDFDLDEAFDSFAPHEKLTLEDFLPTSLKRHLSTDFEFIDNISIEVLD